MLMIYDVLQTLEVHSISRWKLNSLYFSDCPKRIIRGSWIGQLKIGYSRIQDRMQFSTNLWVCITLFTALEMDVNCCVVCNAWLVHQEAPLVLTARLSWVSSFYGTHLKPWNVCFDNNKSLVLANLFTVVQGSVAFYITQRNHFYRFAATRAADCSCSSPNWLSSWVLSLSLSLS